jgi:hypothetical protein
LGCQLVSAKATRSFLWVAFCFSRTALLTTTATQTKELAMVHWESLTRNEDGLLENPPYYGGDMEELFFDYALGRLTQADVENILQTQVSDFDMNDIENIEADEPRVIPFNTFLTMSASAFVINHEENPNDMPKEHFDTIWDFAKQIAE